MELRLVYHKKNTPSLITIGLLEISETEATRGALQIANEVLSDRMPNAITIAGAIPKFDQAIDDMQKIGKTVSNDAMLNNLSIIIAKLDVFMDIVSDLSKASKFYIFVQDHLTQLSTGPLYCLCGMVGRTPFVRCWCLLMISAFRN